MTCCPFSFYSKIYLEVMNRTHTPLYKIVLYKEKMNGEMDLKKHKGLPKYVTDVSPFWFSFRSSLLIIVIT